MAEKESNTESAAAAQQKIEHVQRLVDPFGGDVKGFTAAMTDRQANHKAFLDFVDENLTDKLDFGKIHRPPRSAQCQAGENCTVEWHWTKRSLFKPGAEKVLGWLGATPVWPNLPAYEELALNGDPIQTVILRCEALLPGGSCIGYGMGGRAVAYRDDGTYQDLNRDLKMAKKSALIDCAITSGRLSSHFTQDVEDMPPTGKAPAEKKDPAGKGEQKWMHLKADDPVPSGKHKGEKVRQLDEKYLKALGDKNPKFRKFCDRELDRRKKGTSGPQTTEGWKVPEVAMFTDEMKPNAVKALLIDRYSQEDPAKLTKAQNEDLFAFLQTERDMRELYVNNQELARAIMVKRFGQNAEYRKLTADQMKELKAVLDLRLTIDRAREDIPDAFGQLLDDWENATGEILDTASGEQLKQLITTLQTNGFKG